MSDPLSALPAIVMHMVDGLVTATESGSIESVNPAATNIFGYAEDELRGAPFSTLLEAAGTGQDWILGAIPRAELGQLTIARGRRKDGSTFPLELTLYSFTTSNGLRYAGNLRDVSERQEVDRMKDEFVSVVSHELRTPLTSIRGALQIVLGERPNFSDPEHEPLLNIALSNCERLIRIINDILDVSKIEAGKIELHVKDCSVADVVRTALQSVAEMPKASGVTLASEIDPALPAVRADFDRLVQVLVNLLSNAVKFSPPATTVSVIATHESGHIVLKVRDQGRGIKPENLRRLFQKFQQVDSSPTRRAGGTGLGLAIVKALVEGQKGKVTVESIVDAGTTFTVRLPAGSGSPVETSAAPAANAQAPSGTVLVVDDDVDVRLVIKKQLTKAGYRVIEAADGASAVAMAKAHRPQLITMDLVMPGIGGLAAIRALSDDPETRGIPVVIVSALADQASLPVEASVVAKPFSAATLNRTIAQLLRTSIGTPTVLLAEDDADLRSVLSQALTRSGLSVVAVGDGDAACRAFDAQRFDLVVMDLHMPTMDGFQLISHLRSVDQQPPPPIIVISGATAASGQQSLDLGANLFIAKPVDTTALLNEVQRLLRTGI